MNEIFRGLNSTPSLPGGAVTPGSGFPSNNVLPLENEYNWSHGPFPEQKQHSTVTNGSIIYYHVLVPWDDASDKQICTGTVMVAERSVPSGETPSMCGMSLASFNRVLKGLYDNQVKKDSPEYNIFKAMDEVDFWALDEPNSDFKTLTLKGILEEFNFIGVSYNASLYNEYTHESGNVHIATITIRGRANFANIWSTGDEVLQGDRLHLVLKKKADTNFYQLVPHNSRKETMLSKKNEFPIFVGTVVESTTKSESANDVEMAVYEKNPTTANRATNSLGKILVDIGY